MDELLNKVVDGLVIGKHTKSRRQALEILATICVHEHESMFREFLKDVNDYERILKDYMSVFGVGVQSKN